MDAIRKELRDHARHALIDMNRQKAEGKIARIEVAPGFGFCRFLGHVCPKKYRERVLEAFHAEATKDYFDALKSQDHVRARMIKLCMYPQMAWQVLGALLSQLFAAVCGKFGKPSSDE